MVSGCSGYTEALPAHLVSTIMDTISLILLIFGIAFILAELVLPGGIVVWLGVSSLLLVAARHYGYAQELPDLFMAWSGLSVGLVTFSVVFLQRIFGGEVESKHFDDVEEAVGQVVTVEQLVTADSDDGRVAYQGTSWNARAEGPNLAVGTKAVITGRDNITWIVKAHTEAEEG